MDPRAWTRFRRNKGALVGAALVATITLMGLVGPFVAPHPPGEQFRTTLVDDNGLPHGPGVVDGHPLGGDGSLGRDELSRLLHGALVSMSVAYLATFLALLIGVTIGLLSGYFQGLLDTAAMRTVDLILSMPFLLIAIVLQKVIPPIEASSDPTALEEIKMVLPLCVILGALSWTTLARVTRAKTMEARAQEYVQAAGALGMSHARVLFRHVLPNIAGPIIALATLMVARMIIAESALSFLGLGVTPPTPSWGGMLSESESLKIAAPHLLLLPAALIATAVFGFNLFGEGLRDAFDPKD